MIMAANPAVTAIAGATDDAALTAVHAVTTPPADTVAAAHAVQPAVAEVRFATAGAAYLLFTAHAVLAHAAAPLAAPHWATAQSAQPEVAAMRNAWARLVL